MNVWEPLTTDQSDPWCVVLGWLLSPCFRLLILIAFVVLCSVSCLWVTGVTRVMFCIISFVQLLFLSSLVPILNLLGFYTNKLDLI